MKTRIVYALILALLPSIVSARDSGQWDAADPEIAAWYSGLRQPDNPPMSCCGEADAYWADEVIVEGDKVYAVITDDRDDAPLRRWHVPVGTRILVPPHKYKFDQGNPTGHQILFLNKNRDVYCFVQNGGV